MDIKFPIEENDISGFSRVDIVASAKQKLKNIILTNPGERVMIPNFGVGLKRYLFSQLPNGERTVRDASELKARILNQTSQYAPNIGIVSIDVMVTEEYKVNIKIVYNVNNMVSDTLEIVA